MSPFGRHDRVFFTMGGCPIAERFHYCRKQIIPLFTQNRGAVSLLSCNPTIMQPLRGWRWWCHDSSATIMESLRDRASAHCKKIRAHPCHPRSIALYSIAPHSDRGLRVKPAMTGLLPSPLPCGEGAGGGVKCLVVESNRGEQALRP
jgi:hypothetical protein